MLFGAHGLVGVDNDSDIREYKIMISICMYSFFFFAIISGIAIKHTTKQRQDI